MKFDDHLLLTIHQGYNEEAQTILHHINPCNLVDDSGSTLLHVAASCGNEIITKYLVEKACKIDAVDDNGNTPLILALQKSHYDVVKVLIAANASILVFNKKGQSAAKIIFDQQISINLSINLILQKIKKECFNDSLQTAKELLKANCPFARAARLTDSMILKYMLDNGCEVNTPDSVCCNLTALHISVVSSDVESVKLLISYGADVNAVAKNGYTPLSYIRDYQILPILLDHGALITDNGILSGHQLFQRGNKEIVEMLVMRYDLDFSAKHRRYRSNVLHYLTMNLLFDPVDILKEKIDDSFNVNELEFSNSSALMNASSASQFGTVQFLLEKGAEVNIFNNYQLSALAYACRRQANQKAQVKTVMLLLEYDADVQYIKTITVAHQEIYTTLFDLILEDKTFEIAKLVLAHLALLEILGCEIKDLIFTKIKIHRMFKNYFDFCKITIVKLKRTLVYGRVTLFDFLTVSEEKLINFARYEKLVSRVKLMIYHNRRSNLYYHKVLRKRVAKIIHVENLRNYAYNMVSQILKLQSNTIITEKIIDYLVYDDLKILANCRTFQSKRSTSN